MAAEGDKVAAVFQAMPMARWHTGKEIGRKTSSGEARAGIFGSRAMPRPALTSPATEKMSAPSKMISGEMPASSQN